MCPDSDASGPAVLAYDESQTEISVSFRELYARVASVAGFLKDRGVQPGDRVVAVLPTWKSEHASAPRQDGSKKDTLLNLESLGEFVIHAATEKHAEQVNLSGKTIP